MRCDATAELVHFTRGDDVPAPGARSYAVFSRQDLESWDCGGEYRPETREPLVSFLVRKGGVRDHGGDLRAMDCHKARVGLLRVRGGMTLDDARRNAVEHHYLRDDADINDLLDAINEELHGRKVYHCYDANEGCPF